MKLRWLLLAATVASPTAFAQACCAGTALVSSARLTPHEDLLVGVLAGAGAQLGSLDSTGSFRLNPANTGGADLNQTLVGAVRLLGDGQLSVQVPVVESVRWASGVNDTGGGLGDLLLSFRYDFVLAGESLKLPGLALLSGVAFPTGRSVDQSKGLLSADATGAGVWQGTLGLAVEQTWHQVFAQASVSVQQSLPRRSPSGLETLGPTFSVGLAGGWVFESGAALAIVARGNTSLPAWVNGLATPNTLRAQASFGFGAALPLGEVWRVQAAMTWQLPVGANEVTSLSLSLGLLRSWS